MTVVARVGWSRMLALFHLFSEGVTVQADVVVLNNKNKECDWRVKWESGMCNIKGIFFLLCATRLKDSSATVPPSWQ